MYMKEDTQLIFKELCTIVKNQKMSTKKEPLTPEGTAFIHSLFASLNEKNKMFLKEKIQPTHLTELPRCEDFSYIPKSISAEIHDSCRHFVKYTFHFSKRQFDVFLCTSGKDTTGKHEIQNRIRQIYLWLALANDFVSPTCSNSVHIYLYLIPAKKKLPEHTTDVIDSIHVNTAFTTSCRPHTNVTIHREEEWFRALIHESFHNLGLDFLRLDSTVQKKAENRIRTLFPVTISTFNLAETYCETWAEILNCLILVFINSPSIHSSSSAKNMTGLFTDMLFFETLFSQLQCVKVLHHNHLKYNHLTDKLHATKYKEKTSVFSYYIIKCIFMTHVSLFIHFCATSSTSIQFLLSETNLNRYIDMIIANHHSEKMMKGINTMEKEWENVKKIDILKSTLRMSLFEQ